MTERYDIKYKPLFNQEESGVWEKFAEVEMDARAAYGFAGDLPNILSYYHQEWQYPNNIAFGAFLNGEMIGFAKGHMVDYREYKLASLFVRYEYQRQGIGRKLIKCFENSAALDGEYVQGQCYEWAIPFYKRQGYTVVRGNAAGPEISKKLPKLGKGVYPMFSKWQVKDLRSKIAGVSVDKALLKDSLHQPLFVSINEKSEIDVVGFTGTDDVDTVWLGSKIPEDIKRCREMTVRWQLGAAKSR